MTLQNAFGDIALDSSLTYIREQNDLLRRLLKILEPVQTMDSLNRQKITLDSISSTVALPTVNTVSTVTGVTTVTTVSTVSNISNITTGNIGTLGGVDARYINVDLARTAYNGLRSNINFV